MKYKIKKFKNGRKRYINKYGLEFTEKEKKEIEQLAYEVNKIRAAIARKTKSSKRSKKYKNLGIENPDEIRRRSKNLNQFKEKSLYKAWLKRQKTLLKNPNVFIEEKRRILKQNYLNTLLNIYSVDNEAENEFDILQRMGDSTRKLYENVKNMSDEEFVQLYEDNMIPELNELYQSPEYIDTYIDETYGDFIDDLEEAKE